MSLLDDENILIRQTKCSIWDVIYNAVINENVTQELLEYLNENLRISDYGSWNTIYDQNNICFEHEASAYMAINFVKCSDFHFQVIISDYHCLEENYGILSIERDKFINEIKVALDLKKDVGLYKYQPTILYKNLERSTILYKNLK